MKYRTTLNYKRKPGGSPPKCPDEKEIRIWVNIEKFLPGTDKYWTHVKDCDLMSTSVKDPPRLGSEQAPEQVPALAVSIHLVVITTVEFVG